MTKTKLIPTFALLGVLLLSGCQSDGEIKGIERLIPPSTTTTSSTVNPYLKPPSVGNGSTIPPEQVTRTTISYDTGDCLDRDVSDDEPDVFEEFCD